MTTRRLLPLLALLAGLAGWPPGHAEAMVFAVRHAEKADGPDPGLTERGRARARALADLLADAGITHVFSSDYRRTRETAEPLAARLGLPVLTYDARKLPALVERLNALTGRVLVVGHSNTTPALVDLLGGDPGPPIDEGSEYDRLYWVVPGPDPRSLLLRYGNERDPPKAKENHQ